jgi:hypothetical protein
MFRLVHHLNIGNDRLAKKTMRGLKWNIKLSRYLEANAHTISQELEKYYEQTLSAPELRKHRRWIKRQSHMKWLYEQERIAQQKCAPKEKQAHSMTKRSYSLKARLKKILPRPVKRIVKKALRKKHF